MDPVETRLEMKPYSISIGIQPRYRLDISSSSSSESEMGLPAASNPYRLVQRLGEERAIEISSDDSTDSQYSHGEKSLKRGPDMMPKQNTPDVAFLSSRQTNQSIANESIDDFGDESVVDWLANSTINGSDTLVSEDTATNSFVLAFETQGAGSSLQRSKLATPRKLQYNNVDSLQHGDLPLGHSVKNTESVERRHFDLPKNMPPATTGDFLKHRYVVNDYIILNEIGAGAFAEVRLCKNKTTNKLFAIKIMTRKSFDPKEVAILSKLSHPNVLKLYEVMDDQRGEFIRLN
jgi:hypothetical protein